MVYSGKTGMGRREFLEDSLKGLMGLSAGLSVPDLGFVTGDDHRIPYIADGGISRILVVKSEKRLEVFDGNGRTEGRYEIQKLGQETGAKEMWGDRRTPEGVFYVCRKVGFHEKVRNMVGTRWMMISYPGVDDAERGLREGLISRWEYRKIRETLEKRETPPWGTKLGGLIGIHGLGIYHNRPATRGCIALKNQDVEEFYPEVVEGMTEVEIAP